MTFFGTAFPYERGQCSGCSKKEPDQNRNDHQPPAVARTPQAAAFRTGGDVCLVYVFHYPPTTNIGAAWCHIWRLCIILRYILRFCCETGETSLATAAEILPADSPIHDIATWEGSLL